MKTQNCLSVLFVFMVFTTKIYSQYSDEGYNYIGIKGGISIPNLSAGSSDNPLNSGYSSRLGPDFAIFFEKGLSEKFSFMPQLEYSSQGGQRKGLQALPTPPEIAEVLTQLGLPVSPYVYADFNTEVKLNYLMLSALAKFNWRLGQESAFSFYVEAGPFAGLLLSAHDITSGSSNIYLDEQKQQQLTQDAQSFDYDVDFKDELHTGNFGVTGDLGLSFDLTGSRLFIEGGGNYGFVSIQKDSENGKNHTGAATVRIGYAINF